MINFHTINVRFERFIQFGLKYNKYTHIYVKIRNHVLILHITTGPVYKLHPKWDRGMVPLSRWLSFFHTSKFI